MTGSTPRPGEGSPSPTGLRWSWWNLLLLLPLLMLVTPWYNHDQPRVLGMPVFYWSQFLWVVVGVVSVYLVYRMTNDRAATPVPEPEPGVDTLDEATAGSVATVATGTTDTADETGTPATGTTETGTAETGTAATDTSAKTGTEKTGTTTADEEASR
jgi:hypothetical protein